MVTAGVLVILAALGATEVGKASLLGLLVPLYTKLKKEEILDQFTRGKIYGYILANPGDHYNSIQKTLDIPNGTFAYHLHVLEKEGYIKSTRDGMNRCFFPANMRTPTQERTLRASQRLIVERILEKPGISQREIATSMGVSSSTVSYHVRGLLDLGVVETERKGMRLKYYINRELFATLA
jgi:predicted transcriptional regulator